MKRVRWIVICFALVCLFGCLTVSAEETTTTTKTSMMGVLTHKNGDIPQTVDRLLSQQAPIGTPERLTDDEMATIQAACADKLAKSIDHKADVPAEIKESVGMLKNCDNAVCTENYIYTVNIGDNNMTTEYVYYFDGTVIKTVSYDLNGVQYVAVNHDNRVVLKEGAAFIEESSQQTAKINVYDVLFGMAIAVAVMLVVLAIVKTKKKMDDK